MKGHLLVKIPLDCDDSSIIACLNLYGNLISYSRISERDAIFVYERPLLKPYPIVWCRDNRLIISKSLKLVDQPIVPPFIPSIICERVALEHQRLRHSIEYIISGYPLDISIEQLKLEIIVRFGHFVTIEFKKKFCFAYFDRLVRLTESRFCSIEMTRNSKRKFEESEVCMSCDAFNPVGFRVCTLCRINREFCVYCNRENLPHYKFCGWCGKRVPFLFNK